MFPISQLQILFHSVSSWKVFELILFPSTTTFLPSFLLLLQTSKPLFWTKGFALTCPSGHWLWIWLFKLFSSKRKNSNSQHFLKRFLFLFICTGNESVHESVLFCCYLIENHLNCCIYSFPSYSWRIYVVKFCFSPFFLYF